MAYDLELLGVLTRMFVGEVFRSTKASVANRHNEHDLGDAKLGGFVAIQRFGNALNLHPHLHLVSLDGAYVRGGADAALTFLPAQAPSEAVVREVSARVAGRFVKVLRRRGLLADDDGADLSLGSAPPREAQLVLAAGRAPMALARKEDGRLVMVFCPSRRLEEKSGEFLGFSTHAEVFARAGEAARRRSIIRYCLRPPLAQEQVARTEEGQVSFELRHPRRDGATHVVFEPVAFLLRLGALVPRPRSHQVRYFGLLSSRSKERSEILPKRSPTLTLAFNADHLLAQGEPKATGGHRATWAALLARVYDIDALACESCGGRLRVIAAITQRSVAKKILDHVGLSSGTDPP